MILLMTSFEDLVNNKKDEEGENMRLILMTSFEHLRNDRTLGQQERSLLFNDPNIFCFFSFLNGHHTNRTAPCGCCFLCKSRSRSGLKRNFNNLLQVGQGGCCHFPSNLIVSRLHALEWCVEDGVDASLIEATGHGRRGGGAARLQRRHH